MNYFIILIIFICLFIIISTIYYSKLFQRILPVSAQRTTTWPDNLRMDMHHKIHELLPDGIQPVDANR